jgi:uncharacterized membrane protein YbhN (UPF0104 family)
MRKLFRAGVVMAIAASVGMALRGYGSMLTGRVEQVRVGWLAVAVVLCTVYRVVNAYGWVLVLRSLGHPMPAPRGVRVWLVSETLRWLPGSVWSFFSRVAQARAAGVPAATASLSLPLELFLTIAAWGNAAALGLACSDATRGVLHRLPIGWFVTSLVGLATFVGAVLAFARCVPAAALSKKIRNLGGSLGELRASRLRISTMAGPLALFVVLCGFHGVAFLVMLRAVTEAPPDALATIGINAAGWLLGFFAFFAPAGLGVREAGMAAMLAPFMPVDAAVVGAVLWRLVQLIAEFVCLGACFTPTAIAAVRRPRAETG